MKSIRILIALSLALITPLSMTSCQTTGGGGGTPTNYIPFIAPAAAIATAALLEKAVSPGDRQDKATVATRVAAAIAAITDPGTTGREVAAVILAQTGTKPHWIAFSQVISLLYDRYSVKIEASKYTVILQEISVGITTGATAYVP